MGFFQTLSGSFHSASLYREVRTKASFNMGYTALLVLLCTLLTTIYYANVVHRAVFVSPAAGQPAVFDDVVTQIANQIPVMTYHNGKLVTSEPQATVVTISGELFGEKVENMPFITIDTTGETTHENMKTSVLITSGELIIKTERETKIKPLSDYAESSSRPLVINRALAMDTAQSIITSVHANVLKFYIVVGGLGWMVFAFIAYALRLFMLLGLGLIGTLLGTMIKSPVTFAASMSLAAISYTPIALLETVVLILTGSTVHTLTLLVAGTVALFVAIKISTPAPVMIN